MEWESGVRGERPVPFIPAYQGDARALPPAHAHRARAPLPPPTSSLTLSHSTPLRPPPSLPFNPQIKHDGAECRTTASTRAGAFWDDSRLSL
jgi:hypothetical protein